MKYDFSKEVDKQFEALRDRFEKNVAALDDVEAMERLMSTYGEHWNGEEWTYYLEHEPIYVRPIWEEWDGDTFIASFEFH